MNPIKHTDIAEDGILTSHFQKEVVETTGKIILMQTAIQNVAKELNKSFSGMKVETLTDVEKINTALKETHDLTIANEKVKQALLKTAAMEAAAAEKAAKAKIAAEKQYNKEIEATTKAEAKKIKDIQKTTSAFQQLQKQYNDLAKAQKDLFVQGQTGTKVYQENQKAIVELRTKIEEAEVSVGQFQRNVGNYQNNLTTYSKGLRGFGGLIRLVGEAFGAQTEQIERIGSAVGEAGRAMREFHHTEIAVTVATEAETAATGVNEGAHIANTAAVEAETEAEIADGVAKKANVGWLGALAVLLITGAALVYRYVSAKKEEEEAAQIEIESNKILKEDKEKLNELLEAEHKSLLKLKVLKGEISQLDADNALSGIERTKKLSDATKEYAEKLTKLKETEGLGTFPVSGKNGQIGGGNFNIAIGNRPKNNEGDLASDDELEKIQKFNIKAEDLYQNYMTARKSIDKEYEQEKKTKELEEAKKVNSEKLKLKKEQIKTEGEYEWSALEQEIKMLSEEYKKLTDERIKEEKRLRDEAQSDALFLAQFLNEQADKEKAIKDKQADDDKKRAQEEIDIAKKVQDEITKGIESGLKSKEDLQQKSDQKMIDFHTRTAEIQATLAAGGKANNLGQEQALAAKAEEKKLQDAKKAAKVQEEVAIITAFEKTLQSALTKGEPFAQAFGEAIASSGLVSAAFTAMFSGFYEGTEDTGTVNNPLDNKGGRIAIVHDNERVIPKYLNDKLKGISNEDLVNNYTNGLYLPPSVFVDKKAEENYMLSKKLDAVINAIDNQPKQMITKDVLGDLAEVIRINNITKTIHYKQGKPKGLLNGLK